MTIRVNSDQSESCLADEPLRFRPFHTDPNLAMNYHPNREEEAVLGTHRFF